MVVPRSVRRKRGKEGWATQQDDSYIVSAMLGSSNADAGGRKSRDRERSVGKVSVKKLGTDAIVLSSASPGLSSFEQLMIHSWVHCLWA
jgi:hypothetical protein